MAVTARQPDRRGRVLYVEDNPADVRLVRESLRELPWVRLVVAGTRDEALAVVAQDAPDLVLVDLNLPGGNGIQLIRELRQSEATRYTPIVALSGTERPSDVLLTYSAGASAFVRKPPSAVEHRRALLAIATFWCEIVEPPVPLGTPGAP